MSEPIRVLNVDDYPLDRALVRDALVKEHGGFVLVEAASRAEFEAQLAEGTYDVILSDFNILGYDGLSVIEAARARAPGVPVILVTGTGSEEVAVEAMRRGAADYVIKTPQHIQRLPITIQAALDKRRLMAEQAQAAETLRQSEERRELALRGADLGTWDWNVQTGAIAFNERWAEMLGYTLAEIRPDVHSWEELVHPADMPGVTVVLNAHLQGETPGYEAEHRLRHKSGRWIWVLNKGRVIERDATGKPLRACGTHLDITERKRAEDALRASEERYRTVANFTYDWESWLGTDGRIIYCSPSVRRVTGYSAEELLANPALLETMVHPADRPAVADHWRQAGRANSDDFALDYRILTKGGEERWVSHCCMAVYDEQGHDAGRRGSTRDITDRKRLEEQLRQAQKLEAVGTLAAGVAHDFNNALMAILGHARAARLALPHSHKVLGDLDGIVKASEQASAVTKSLLMFSREAAAQMVPVNLGRIVRDAAQMLNRMLPAAVEMTVEASESDDLWIEGDAVQLDQVLVNLSINARDAMPDGGQLRITVSSRPAEAADVWSAIAAPSMGAVRMVVEDCGTGMSADVLARVCDPFFTTKTREQGTGLGMSVVHGIVESHQGHMQIESAVGRGTCVTIEFARCLPPTEVDTETMKPAPVHGDGATILVAEDNAQVRAVIASALKAAGYDVIQAANGLEAMEAFDSAGDGVRLAVLDVDMPKMSGKACLKRLRKVRPGFPVIMMSGFYDVSFYGSETEGVTLLQKPFRIAELVRLVGELLEVVGTREG